MHPFFWKQLNSRHTPARSPTSSLTRTKYNIFSVRLCGRSFGSLVIQSQTHTSTIHNQHILRQHGYFIVNIDLILFINVVGYVHLNCDRGCAMLRTPLLCVAYAYILNDLSFSNVTNDFLFVCSTHCVLAIFSRYIQRYIL